MFLIAVALVAAVESAQEIEGDISPTQPLRYRLHLGPVGPIDLRRTK
jgi:hypothetical protein